MNDYERAVAERRAENQARLHELQLKHLAGHMRRNSFEPPFGIKKPAKSYTINISTTNNGN